MLSLLVYIEDRTTIHYEELKDGQRRILEETQRMVNQTPTFRNSVKSLSAKLSTLDINEPSLVREYNRALKVNQRTLLDNGQKLDVILALINDQVSALSSRIQSLEPAMDRDLVSRRRILQSLYFAKMNDRRDHVRRAHGSTYQWIFRPKGDNANETVVWDDFLKWLCGQAKSNFYWVFGKPGCGKTTLMRELDERITQEIVSHDWERLQKDPLRTALRQWVGQGDLLKGCCYFWYAGSAEQKSLTGLLKSLVRQLLEQRPDLIDKVVSSERWTSTTISDFQWQSPPWDEKELTEVLERIVVQTEQYDRIVLFVDGLDEYDGSDERRNRLLDIMRQLTKGVHVKACLASRPWNIFRDALDDCAKIRLEDLTRADIQMFVHETLEADRLFQKLQRREPEIQQRIAALMTTKARGVFLWVRLVVRDLLKVLRDGGRSSDMFLELERVPSDLDDYFKRIMETIDPAYRAEAARILQIALCNMDYEREDIQNPVSGPSLHLLHIEYLEAFADPCFAAKDLVHAIDQRLREDDLNYVLEIFNRRLSSRCMGLLEANPSSWRPPQQAIDGWLIKVEFLHRTVKDFLMRPTTQDLLKVYLQGIFDAHLFRCNLLIVNVATSIAEGELERRFDSLSCFFRHIINRANPDNASFILFDKMVDLVGQNLLVEFESQAGGSFPIIHESIAYGNRDRDNAMSLAIKLGWKPYIRARLTRESLQEKKGRPLLDYALRRCCYKPFEPCLWTVRRLLDLGADPCEPTGLSSKFPIWFAFFIYIVSTDKFDRRTIFEMASLLLKQCVRSRVSVEDIREARADLIAMQRREIRFRRFRRFRPNESHYKSSYLSGTTAPDSLLHLREELDQFVDMAMESNKLLFSPSDVLQHLIWWPRQGARERSFTDLEISQFKDLERESEEARAASEQVQEHGSDVDVSLAGLSDHKKRKRRRSRDS